MATKKPSSLKIKVPANAFKKPLTFDYKQLFKGLAKGGSHALTGKWSDVGADALDVVASIGLASDPEELSFTLIKRSLISGLIELLEDSLGTTLSDLQADAVSKVNEIEFDEQSTYIDKNFFKYPAKIPALEHLSQNLVKWLVAIGIDEIASRNISFRLPAYFVYALNQEWRKNRKSYLPIIEASSTPFTEASEREWAWAEYGALLCRRVNEGVFNEPFSLSQIYVPLNAYFTKKKDRRDTMSLPLHGDTHVVVALEDELQDWLKKTDPSDAIRVVSGGPGSGKSSFARVFANSIGTQGQLKTLFVPLHLIDPSKDLVQEVGRFTKDEGILPHNPLDPDNQQDCLLVIFDGLDELSSMGKAAAETASAFVREVERVTNRFNLHTVRLRVLLCGREVSIQENQAEFRRPRQVLTLLPYYQNVRRTATSVRIVDSMDEYVDEKNILDIDLRNVWWKKYGALTGNGFSDLPEPLRRNDLSEVTAQPLLNYLVALSFTRNKIDFTQNVNLNSVYGDLVTAVHERGYEKHRSYGPIRHMTADQFSRVLEEVGLAAWHGDGRSTTVREIENHCKSSGLDTLLDYFKEGAKAGVTKLLAAFFFRQQGERAYGDPTFVFTHKSFGEYLTAKRIVRAMTRISKEVHDRSLSPDAGWDEKEALKQWSFISGPTAISSYLHTFLINEIDLLDHSHALQMQATLEKLFNYMIKNGVPMELVPATSFKQVLFQSRNCEEALLVVLNALARKNRLLVTIIQVESTAFGTWFRRIQGQRTGPEGTLVNRCLSYLNLRGATLDICDFYGVNFYRSDLSHATMHFCNLVQCNFREAILEHTILYGAVCSSAIFISAKMNGSDLRDCEFHGANFERAEMKGANMKHQHRTVEQPTFSTEQLAEIEQLEPAPRRRSPKKAAVKQAKKS